MRGGRGLLANPFHIQDEFHYLRGRSQILGDPEIRQGKTGAARKSPSIASPGIFAGADLLHLNGQRAGNAAQGEVPLQQGLALAPVFEGGADEPALACGRADRSGLLLPGSIIQRMRSVRLFQYGYCESDYAASSEQRRPSRSCFWCSDGKRR